MTNQLNKQKISTASAVSNVLTNEFVTKTIQTIPAGWLVAFGCAGVYFKTRSEAWRYAKGVAL